MAHRYNAFLVRYWLLDEEQGRRIEVVNLTTGQRSLATSLAAAVAWVQEAMIDAAAARSPPDDVPAGPGDTTRH